MSLRTTVRVAAALGAVSLGFASAIAGCSGDDDIPKQTFNPVDGSAPRFGSTGTEFAGARHAGHDAEDRLSHRRA